MVALQTRQIEVLPGQRTILHDLNWQEFESILDEFGEKRATRIAYFAGTLEIRRPLPEHERAKVLISHLLVALLDTLGWEWESLGSTTFKNSAMQAGLEPDDCFYIQNYQLEAGEYIDTQTSPTFAELPIRELISECLARSASEPMSAIRRDFQSRILSHFSKSA